MGFGEGDDNSKLDWLPVGWKMEVKVRKNGRKDKYYIDPSNEHRFQSKPEALRYFENMENNHLLYKGSNKGNSNDVSPTKVSPTKFVDKEAVLDGDDNSPLDWLPAGWKMEVKVRKSGKKDKYYIDPSNEHKYHSKPEVIRYLKNEENNHPICEESKKGSSTDVSPEKCVDKEAVSENIPEGWTKNFRVTRSGSRKDPYYIDPESGQQFVSTVEVFRYLNSKKTDIQKNEKCASSPEDKSILKSGARDYAVDLPSTPERRKLRSDSNKEAQKPVFENQIAKTEASIISKQGHKLKPCNEKDKSSEVCSTVKLVKTEKDLSVKKMEMEEDTVLTEKIPTAERVGAQEDIQTVGSKNKRKIRKELEFPRRSSKRLAGVEVVLTQVLELPTRVNPATVKPTGEEDETVCSTHSNTTSDDSVLQKSKRVKITDKDEARRALVESLFNEEQEVFSVDFEKPLEQRIFANAVLEKHPELGVVANTGFQMHPEQGSSNADSEKHPEQKVINLVLKNEPEQGSTDALIPKQPDQRVADVIVPKQQDEHKDCILKKQPEQGIPRVVLKKQPEQGFTDIIIPKQQPDQRVADLIVPKQQDEQKDGILKKQGELEMDLASSLGGLWNDPCIEFAIKTLTGDLPVVSNDVNHAKTSVDAAAGPSSCQESPLGDLWSDPCFEFAVKTLTGDIPPTVDTSCIQTNIQNQKQQHWSSKSGATGFL